MKITNLRASDIRAIHLLIGECRELGDDSLTWRRHLCAGMSRLISAEIVGGLEISGGHFGAPKLLGDNDWGWEAGFNRQGWINAIEIFRHDPFGMPAAKVTLERLRTRVAVTATRPRLLSDKQWYGHHSFEAVQRVAGIDALLYSFRHLPRSHDDFNVIVATRAAGRPEFDDRERRLAAYLHRELAPFIGGPLARFAEPSPSTLAPRVRQVLRGLLEGDGDKQIAARLKLSQHTVNQYTKTIFCHFGVSSRAELLARWLRHEWTARCEWLAQGETSARPREERREPACR